MRETFAENDKRFKNNPRLLLAYAPCDDEYRAYLLDIATRIRSEMQGMQTVLLDLAKAIPPHEWN